MDDIVTSIVIDNGSGSIKAGFAGDNEPKTVFPTLVARPSRLGRLRIHDTKDIYIGEEALDKPKRMISHPIENGIITNWDDMEQVWHYMFNELKVAPEKQSVLLTEAISTPKEKREKMTQIMFETFHVPAMYTATQAGLALESTDFQTGLVLDSGDNITQIVPVFKSHVILDSALTVNIGGRDFTSELCFRIETPVVADAVEGNVSGPSSSHIFIPREIGDEIKQKLCYVALDYQSDFVTAVTSKALHRDYDMPDGSIITLGQERFEIPEGFFQPNILRKELNGIHELIRDSIVKCDEHIRSELYSKIILIGGSTMFPCFGERLQKELKAFNTNATILASPNRKYATWLGGSKLASKPSFQQSWISRKEYDEYGPSIVHRKCVI